MWEVRHTPQKKSGGDIVALKLELSASITDDRIHAVLGDTVAFGPLPSLPATTTCGDSLTSKHQRPQCAKLCGASSRAIPQPKVRPCLSLPLVWYLRAVELGRVWMPKADHSHCLRRIRRLHHALTIERK